MQIDNVVCQTTLRRQVIGNMLWGPAGPDRVCTKARGEAGASHLCEARHSQGRLRTLAIDVQMNGGAQSQKRDGVKTFKRGTVAAGNLQEEVCKVLVLRCSWAVRAA